MASLCFQESYQLQCPLNRTWLIRAEIKELITLLPDPQREVLLMRVKDELSFKEIADKTNCSINTALGRMRYAILNLRHMAYERGISLAS